ncbi:bifunctional phosphoribosyl-AMP cyclohydrolase/phosphoribosyl-ATP diphosphatase HisIE [Candidatus Caldatribacterium saccharofermentans]|uniref:Histidine biosynthesis bifunctional protein HisIE n=1 Tax=Candidatus Caldatribacterium saccharofermentans TaxID=1454753 RepID=A0A7V4TEK8_9BACT
MGVFEELRFDEHGLIPAVVQDAVTGKVLMVAYMNEEALRKTLETRTTWFYSRSRKTLWHKGETSGHVQHVERVYVDCDRDCLLVQVRQEGVACHTGFFSCFHRMVEGTEILEPRASCPASPLLAFLGDLFSIIEERAKHPSPSSYTARLLAEGKEKILRKVAEEATEVLLAAFEGEETRRDHLRYEVADLLYHLLVLLKHEGLTYVEVMEELSSRHIKAQATTS